MTPPTLTTPRLTLRPFTLADFDVFAAIWADPVVTAHIGVPARDRGASWQSFLMIAGGWALLGHGQWAIADRATGVLLGQTGFFRVIRGYGAHFDDLPEAGWVLSREAMGRGYGTEAVRAAHDWFDAHVGGPTVAQIDGRNAASQALASRMGYRVYAEVGGEEAGHGAGLGLYRRG
jgi:RimJ/RimL family protein N-acetyltransferase